MNRAVSVFPFANLAPVRLMGRPEGCTFVFQDPRQSGEAIASGQTIAAPVPVAAIPAMSNLLEFPGSYGVAASERVGSVLLFSRVSFDKLSSNHTVFLSGQSSTSVLLLYLLLKDRRTESLPAVTRASETADAVLLIGDDALVYKNAAGFANRLDLVTLWHEACGKPFVFARWAVRKDADTRSKNSIRDWLSRLDREDDRLVEASAGLEAQRLGIPRDEMISYLRAIRRVLTREDLEGQEYFLNKAGPLSEEFALWRNPDAGDRGYSKAGMKRIDLDRCVRLLGEAPLGELMAAAHEERMRRHPGGLVTYVIDTNPNYTNICTVECSFCAFHRRPGDPAAYTLTPDELAEKVADAERQGATTVLLQGGLNPAITLDRVREYLRRIRQRCPNIQIHPFGPPEIGYLADLGGLSVDEVLRALWDEGVHTIPGGGAEILTERVRGAISPGKCPPDRWIAIMEAAHRIGFQTTATMMYGHIESLEEIARHLKLLRDSQDRTGGYSSFIGWSFKPGGTKLGKTVARATHPAFYIRLIAVSRLFLDNFDHIQSSWFSESENAGCLGLMAGADDFGGILVEENVHKTAGHERTITVDRIHDLIRQSGFVPARRDSFYQIREVMGREDP